MRSRSLLPALLLIVATCMPPAEVVTEPSHELRMRFVRDIGMLADTTIVLRFDLPFVYEELHQAIEECSGRKSHQRDTYWVAQRAPLRSRFGPATALHFQELHRVVFALGEEDHMPTIAHEHLHHLHPELTETLDYAAMHPDSVFGRSAPCAQYLYP